MNKADLCRKLAAQKAMLNRGEAPSAQLFAISEEAEIRYTNGGLLYEVPAAERAGAASARARQAALTTLCAFTLVPALCRGDARSGMCCVFAGIWEH